MTLRPDPDSAAAQRTGRDRCPGVFATHVAADGPLARIRLPGGALRAGQLRALAAAATDFGDGVLELTGRANIQLRGITDVDAVAESISAAGLSDDAATDRHRNIVASPLSGRVGGISDIRPIVDALDAALRAGAAPPALSRRFWFGVDDGRGDVIDERPDVTLVATGSDRFDLLLDGAAVGSVGTDSAVEVLMRVAAQFADAAPDAWRVRDVDARLAAAIATRVGSTLAPATGRTERAHADRAPLVGWFPQDDGRVLLGATAPLGRLPARTAEFLAAIEAPLIVTPHREMLICDLTEAVADTVVRILAPMGLIFDASSPWTRVSSCAGAPGCARALAPVREQLSAYVADVGPESITQTEHWVGCARGCGSPARAHVRVEATGPTGQRRTPMS